MDGRSAADHAVSVVIGGDELVVSNEAGAVLARFPLETIRVDATGEGGVAHVESPSMPDALLTVDDALFVKGLRGSGARVRGTSVGRRALVIGAICFAIFAGLMGGLYLGAPRLSEALAHRIPPSMERGLGSQMTTILAKNTCETPAARQAVDSMVRRLDPDHHTDVAVRIVNVGVANAFALPGSVVLLTRGLLEKAESADEIAGVLAHELAHVEHRHALSHMIRNAFLGGIWAATLGDYSGMMVVDPKTAYETATLKYSREAESEADDTALRTLTRQRISAHGLADFLKRHQKGESTDLGWLSTHPASSDRVARLSSQHLAEAAIPALDADAFYELRKACESARSAQSFRDLFF